MKATAAIDWAAGTARLEITLERLEDGGEAVDAVKAATRALWPDAVFSGEPDYPDEEGAAAKAETRKRKPMDFSRPPAPGSFGALVLEAARRLKTEDAIAIADDLDRQTGVTAMTLARLRRGGHL